MKVFASICVSLVICQLGGTSVLPGQIEKEQLKHLARYNSVSEPVLPNPSNSLVLTTCNGVLDATNGGISYKAFEPIAANERCVWTIRAGIPGWFSLNVLNLGFSSSRTTQLVATCLIRTDQASHILLDHTGPVSGVYRCNVIVITFASGWDVRYSTGFVLEYAAGESGSRSPLSQDYILNAGAAGVIRHPISAPEYENFELSTFVFLPTLGSYTNIIYIRGTLEDNLCFDSLSVYRFNATSVVPTKWKFEGMICGNIVSEFIGSGDLILISFDTDASRVGTGFQLAFAANGASKCSMQKQIPVNLASLNK